MPTNLEILVSKIQNGTLPYDLALLVNALKEIGEYKDWKPLFGGFAAPPEVTFRYILLGKICFFRVYTDIFGLSANNDADSKVMSMPFRAARKANQDIVVPSIINNSNIQANQGLARILAGEDVCIVYRNPTTTMQWTPTGEVGWNFQGHYEIL
jgi:hypothetical protein